MTDDTHTFDAAYERLTTALIPPAGAGPLVAARVAQRRRRRRTTQGVGSVLAAGLLAGGVAVALNGGAAPVTTPSYAADTTASATTTDTTDPAETATSVLVDPLQVERRDISCDDLVLPDEVLLQLNVQRALNQLPDLDTSHRRVEVDGDHVVVYVLNADDKKTFVVDVHDDGGRARVTQVGRCTG